MGLRHIVRRWLAGALCCAALGSAWASDPLRGERLFMTPPASGLLGCADCHSDNPQLNNFGNIWVGRNNVALIQRAVSSNTGGMGYFASFYSETDLADIAAWLGNAPARLDFPLTLPGSTSAAQRVTISTSTKAAVSSLALAVEGQFVVIDTTCSREVARFSSCTIELAFRPDAQAGEVRDGALVISHDGTPTPARLPLRGLVQSKPPAVARVSPPAIDFGNVALGLESSTRVVSLANGSASDLVLGQIVVETPAVIVSGGSCHAGLVLGEGQSCLVALRLAPTAAGAVGGRLAIAHDGVGGGAVVSLTGVADASAGAALVAEPGAWDFGVAASGERVASGTLTLANRGARALLLRELATTDAAFTVERSSCAAGATLLPGQACQVQLSWAPARDGAMSAELRVAADGLAAPLRLPLAGRAASAVVQASPARLSFDGRIGGSQTLAVHVVNRGSVATVLGTLALSGPEGADFGITGDSSCVAGFRLGPGSACAVRLSFRPAAAGERRARLLASADGGAAPIVVELFGQARPDDAAALWLDATVLRFDERLLFAGSLPQSLPVTLVNRGGAPLPAPSLRLIGTSSAAYQLSGGCNADLPAGGSCRIEVRFEPGVVGTHRASLRIGGAQGRTLALVSIEGRAVMTRIARATLPPVTPTGPVWANAGAAAFAPTAVGDVSAGITLNVSNPGAAITAALVFSVSGGAGADFSIDAASPCAAVVLVSGAGCSLRLHFHPSAGGERRALLRIASSPGPTIELSGRGLAPARGALVAEPVAVVFQARTDRAAAAQRVTITNLGAADVAIIALTLQGNGFTLAVGGGPGDCPPDHAVLLPGEECSVDLSWSGGAAASLGAVLAITAADAFASTSVPVSVSEDPAQQSNVGTGGGALSWIWLAALAGLVLLVTRWQRAARRQCRHG